MITSVCLTSILVPLLANAVVVPPPPVVVDQPQWPEPRADVRSNELFVDGFDEELAVDDPLNPNASQNIRPTDYLVVDRNYDLFADPRLEYPEYRYVPVRTPWWGGFYPPRVILRTVPPTSENTGRLKALENPGFDDRIERGKVPSRFDVGR
ncbi:MAG TPA: hypothetical protein VGN72_21905 [Tepidisphaeraceae bacterium]|jgi:hypothetical protein|nr:hypothetical protein [Tepidisphaeraceae bacterium]